MKPHTQILLKAYSLPDFPSESGSGPLPRPNTKAKHRPYLTRAESWHERAREPGELGLPQSLGLASPSDLAVVLEDWFRHPMHLLLEDQEPVVLYNAFLVV